MWLNTIPVLLEERGISWYFAGTMEHGLAVSISIMKESIRKLETFRLN